MATFMFQDPNDAGSRYLLEKLIEASTTATSGGGAFAFASRRGIELLFNDEAFAAFLARGRFQLVVGVDATTDTRAIERLKEYSATLPNLAAEAFLSPDDAPIFHPKFCWFRTPEGGLLVAGSGNLTRGGLRGNWEAFVVETLNVPRMDEFEASWNRFRARAAGNLAPLDHDEVTRRAADNVQQRRVQVPSRKRARPVPSREPVLIAEIPRSGGRQSQVNFKKLTFDGFFGVEPHTSMRGCFYDVLAAPGHNELECRAPVVSKSINFRFELNAIKSRPYPDEAPPIGVYVTVSARNFLYCILFPGDPGFDQVQAFLAAHAVSKSNQKLELQCTAADLAAAWPNSPLWTARFPVNADV